MSQAIYSSIVYHVSHSPLALRNCYVIGHASWDIFLGACRQSINTTWKTYTNTSSSSTNSSAILRNPLLVYPTILPLCSIRACRPFFVLMHYDGKVITCNLFELSILKYGECEMLFDLPDVPCCMPHLRLRGIWPSVLFDWDSSSPYTIKVCDKFIKLTEVLTRFGVSGEWSLDVPLLRSVHPILAGRKPLKF